MSEPAPITLETATECLRFDPRTGCLASLRRKAAADQELLAPQPDDPAFVVQYLDDARRYHQISSRQAATVTVTCETLGDATLLTAQYRALGGLALHVTFTVRAAPQEALSRWALTLHNDAGLRITDVQFPFVVAPYHLHGAPGSEALVWPLGPGMLIPAPKPEDLAPDNPHTWQLCPENSDATHYPGYTFAQFLAYYNDRAGIYLACQDAAGRIKLLKPVHHAAGLRLGVAHVGDWPTQGARRLEYEVVLGTFTGDWHAAAELYRAWSLQQPWAQRPLHARQDVPAWLLDSPPHVIVRIQGQLDIGPTEPNAEFLPYPKTIPLLDRIAQRLDAPLVPVIMSWERPGPWIYPDCFPPAGGAASLREFCDLARQRGWHIGTFCNGTRWVTGHFWSGYDGEDYYRTHGGPQSVCRTVAGEPWHENWDATWRPSYAACLGVPLTREIATGFLQTVMDLGLDWVQFFDQNVGCSTFPCFAADHGHPALPGQWMTASMRTVLDTFQALVAAETSRSGDTRRFALSVEGPVNEHFLPDFQICDIRVVPPGHMPSAHFVPLYHYLYHEFILIQGGFGAGPEPYHMPIRSAYNLVVGEIPGAVLKGDGQLLNNDTFNWAPWEPQIGDNEAALQMLRAVTALRRGPARPYLVFGRMAPPAQVQGIKTIRWQDGGRDNQIPAVFHEAWLAPDGRVGIVLANWTPVAQTVQVVDARLGAAALEHSSAAEQRTYSRPVTEEGLTLTVPALGCLLVETPQTR